jgi:hypothetical protein
MIWSVLQPLTRQQTQEKDNINVNVSEKDKPKNHLNPLQLFLSEIVRISSFNKKR